MSSLSRTLCLQTKSGAEGSGWFGQELTQAIAEAGVEVVYVAPPAEPRSREPSSDNVVRRVVPREVPSPSRLRRTYSSLRRIFLGMGWCLQARLRTSRFLFSVPDPLLFFLPLQVVLRLTGARVYLVVHDAVPHAWTLPPPVRFLQRWSLMISYNLCTQLFPTTSTVETDLHSLFRVPHTRTHVIPHGAYVVGTTSEPPGTRSLLLFGTLRRNKGVLEAIKAVQMARAEGLEVNLKVAGAPDKLDQGYWQDCAAQIATAPDGISTEIGFVPDDQVETLIVEADAVLLPYRDFSSQSGVAILMISGARPVIASEIGGIADLFAAGMSGIPLSNHPDAEEISVAIRRFCQTSSATWHQQALAAREVLSAKLDWAVIGQQYAEAMFGNGAPTEVLA